MPTSTESQKRRPTRRWLLIGAALIAVVSPAVVWVVVKDHPAEKVVQDFFDALRADDVEAAVALVDTDRTPGEDAAAFLVPEAVNFPWDTPETEVVELDGTYAKVAVTVATGAGAERAEYEVEHYGGEWLLDSPWISVTFDWVPVDYGQVNDAIALFQYPVVEGATTPGPTFDLFPGEYDFYQSVPEVVEIESDEPSTLLTPSKPWEDWQSPSNPSDDSESMRIDPPRTTFEPEAIAEIQQAVDAQMVECLASTKSSNENCPFWLSEPIFNADGEELSHASDLEWSLEEPLTVTLGEWESGGFSFPVESVVAGKPVSVTGTALNRDADFAPETFTTHCTVNFSGWQVTLTSDGEQIGIELTVARTEFNAKTCDTEL